MCMRLIKAIKRASILQALIYNVKHCSYLSRLVLSETWAYLRVIRVSLCHLTYPLELKLLILNKERDLHPCHSYHER